MQRCILVALATVVTAWAYPLLLVWTTGRADLLAVPRFWASLHLSRDTATLVWMTLSHTVAVVAASIPPALVIWRLFPRRWLIVSLALTLPLAALSLIAPDFDSFGSAVLDLAPIRVFDRAKLIATLPLLVLVARRCPLTIAWSGS